MTSADILVALACTSLAFMFYMFGLILLERRPRLTRRRFRPYDGGCRHRPQTCTFCREHHHSRQHH